MKAATVEGLRAARTRFWVAIVVTFVVVQFVNFASAQQEGYAAAQNPAVGAVALLGHLAFGVICVLFSRSIGQEGWKTAVVGVLAIFSLIYLVSVIWLAVDCNRRLKELQSSGAGAPTP